ncbi:MAG: hypothetical protein M1828_000914 [Chrysothrix sp. TS-e1954]|nr:MAG: hypothetical protein M1828_000914 [Chrysothrix sp. TS-e1954]
MPGQSPVEELPEPKFSFANGPDRSSDEERTIVSEGSFIRPESAQRPEPVESIGNNLTLNTEALGRDRSASYMSMASPSHAREQAHRLDDDLRMLQVERQVSHRLENGEEEISKLSTSNSTRRERSRREEPVDDFDVATNPLHEQAAHYRPPEHPSTNVAKFMKKVHNSSWLVRYFTYISPVVLIILIPLLIGAILNPAKRANVGGVRLVWFCIWLEIVWLTLWAGRLLAKMLPWPIGLVATLFTNNGKKWRDMGKQLELPATLFFWWLAIEISFLPTMKNHHVDGNKASKSWELIMNKVLIAFFVGVILNFIEKIIIQLIAINFHLRTYQDRIELNKFQIGSLTKLYTFSKAKIAMEDSEFEAPSGGPGSGARTPGQYLEQAQKGTVEAFNKFGDVAGKIAGDFTGKAVKNSGHPHQVVLSLLSSSAGSQVLARRLYRTFARDETETIHQEDLNDAFENQDEADAAFSMFDKDLNGDISMTELEAVCVEIGRERKSITASLKDLDSVVGKLDSVMTFVVVVVFVLVLISLLSTSAAGVLTSAGSTVLALSWLFSTTAQEFLQSVIFVFVKHPFDVGDRVTVYGTTGSALQGDDYFVKEISLLFTEFKKMEGHVVQAPNSYLNTLFILNMRRSGGLAEAVPMTFKFGTTLEQIDGLRTKLLEFVKAEKREYQANILTELRDVVEAHSITLNIVFFFKSNWQNELLRLQRRNKFMCALMICMQELGIEGPRMRFPGQKESFPLYMANLPWSADRAGHGGNPDNPAGGKIDESFVPTGPSSNTEARSYAPSVGRTPSAMRRPRGESVAQMGKRYDFSLGMNSISAGDMVGDVYDDRGSKPRVPIKLQSASPESGRKASTSRMRADTVARSTSRSSAFHPGQLNHRVTEPSRTSTSVHRNRFFGRGSHESERMESGMAGIPESRPLSQHMMQPLDPRSGLISPAAMRTNTNETMSERRNLGLHPEDRANAEDYEMERLQ